MIRKWWNCYLRKLELCCYVLFGGYQYFPYHQIRLRHNPTKSMTLFLLLQVSFCFFFLPHSIAKVYCNTNVTICQQKSNPICATVWCQTTQKASFDHSLSTMTKGHQIAYWLSHSSQRSATETTCAAHLSSTTHCCPLTFLQSEQLFFLSSYVTSITITSVSRHKNARSVTTTVDFNMSLPATVSCTATDYSYHPMCALPAVKWEQSLCAIVWRLSQMSKGLWLSDKWVKYPSVEKCILSPPCFTFIRRLKSTGNLCMTV